MLIRVFDFHGDEPKQKIQCVCLEQNVNVRLTTCAITNLYDPLSGGGSSAGVKCDETWKWIHFIILKNLKHFFTKNFTK